MASVSSSTPPPTVLLVTHEACTWHNIQDHPEQPLRVPSIVNALTEAFPPGSSPLVLEKDPQRVEVEALLRFHTSKHVDSVLAAFDSAEAKARQVLNNDPPKTSPTTGGGANKGGGGIANEGAAAAAADSPSAASSEFFSLCAAEVAKKSELGNKLSSTDGVIQIDGVGDTACMWGTGEAAMRAAGAAIHAVDGVMMGKHASAFVAVRPPGHHAEPDQAMGFCLFANAGVAALHARATYGLTRVAVIDWDVHHGNGTQAFFEKDPDLFFASSHQMPCYPGTGSPKETGVANNVVNVGLKPGSGSQAFREAWASTILPALATFDPELVVVSAGFDAHGDDPLAEVRLVDEDFYWVQKEILKVCHKRGGACRGRVVSVLEGGYNLEAISRSAVGCVRAQIEAAAEGEAAPPAEGGAEAEEEAVGDGSISEKLAGLNFKGGEQEAKTCNLSSSYYDEIDLPPGSEDEDEDDVGDEEKEKEEVASLDAQIFKGFQRCLSNGVLRTTPIKIETHQTHTQLDLPFRRRRCVDSPHGFLAAFDQVHFEAKRPATVTTTATSSTTAAVTVTAPATPAPPPAAAAASPVPVPVTVTATVAVAAAKEAMNRPFNPNKFHFGKANPLEQVATVHTSEKFAAQVKCELQRLTRVVVEEKEEEDEEEEGGGGKGNKKGGQGTNNGGGVGAMGGGGVGAMVVTQQQQQQHAVLANASPLMIGHCVLPLWCDQGLNQALHDYDHNHDQDGDHEVAGSISGICRAASISAGASASSENVISASKGLKLVSAAVEICAGYASSLSTTDDDAASFRIGFNSLDAFASVNHFHLHLMYTRGLSGDTKGGTNRGGDTMNDSNSNAPLPRESTGDCGFPVEAAPVKKHVVTTVVQSDSGGGMVQVDLLDWPVPCFSFTAAAAAAPAGTKTASGEASVVMAAAVVGRFLNALAEKGTPYNVLFVPPMPVATSSTPTTAPTFVGGGKPSLLRIVVFPRLPQSHFNAKAAGFNGAVCELSGLLVHQTKEHFENPCAGADAAEALRTGAALPASRIEELVGVLREWA